MWFRLHFVLLLVGSMVGLAQAQNATNFLAGTIQDISGAVIVGAQVALVTQNGRIVTQGITDSSGNFRFMNVSAGSYTIDVVQQRHPNYFCYISLTHLSSILLL